MATCPNCKTSVGNAKFCPECGTKIPQESREDFEKQVEDFFEALENASPEDRDAFFKLIEEDLKKKKGQK